MAIKSLVEEKNIPELKKLLLHRMAFGTAGRVIALQLLCITFIEIASSFFFLDQVDCF